MDRGEEKAELWLINTLTYLENIALLLVSRWFYLPGYPLSLLLVQISVIVVVNVVALILYLCGRKRWQCGCFVWFFLLLLAALNLGAVFLPWLFVDGLEAKLFPLDLIIVVTNILGLVVAYIYTKKFELYADIQHLPNILPDLPSFGAEVRTKIEERNKNQNFWTKNLISLCRMCFTDLWRLVDMETPKRVGTPVRKEMRMHLYLQKRFFALI